MNSKFEFLFPKRLYRCSCLQVTIEECFVDWERSFADIVYYLTAFDSRNLLSKRIFAATVGENNEHCLLFYSQLIKKCV